MICLGGLLIAIFALAGNVPWLSSIQLIPGVPVTLQIFLIAIMGLIMGTKNGLIVFASLLLLTLCGVPTMSGGRGGPSVFVGPTSGVHIRLGVYNNPARPLQRLHFAKDNIEEAYRNFNAFSRELCDRYGGCYYRLCVRINICRDLCGDGNGVVFAGVHKLFPVCRRRYDKDIWRVSRIICVFRIARIQADQITDMTVYRRRVLYRMR